MAGQAGNYVQTALLSWFKGTAFPSSPANLYAALFTTAPTNAGGGVEVSGGSYARVAISSAGWGSVTGNSPASIVTSAATTFTTPTAAWGTVVAYGLFDAASGGNLIVWNTLANPQAIIGSQPVQFAAGAITVQAGATGNIGNYVQNAILNWIKGTAFPSTVANTYIDLYTAAPSNAGGGTFVSGGSYARAAVASSQWGAVTSASPANISTNTQINFPTPTANWGMVGWYAIYDTIIGGNLLVWAALTGGSIAILSGNPVDFAVGALAITAD